ncbi:cytochrome P450 [Microbacterium sp. 22303]|uniref:cytochrome P450 n=1 Tax=Microbacterium sp. 22303 TaxID=3453905 RepID=UPI003F85F214
MDTREIDSKLTSAEFFADPSFHETFAYLRSNDPVHWTDGDYARGFWSVTRHEDCKAILGDPETFSSQRGTHLPVEGTDLSEEEKRTLGFDAMLPFNDAPRHPTLRRPVNKHFTVPSVARMRTDIEKIVDDILDGIAEAGECDLMIDVVAEMPARLFLGMFNVPNEHWRQVRTWTMSMMHPNDPAYQLPGKTPEETWRTSMLDLHKFLVGLAEERRANPLDNDFASVIAHMEVDGELLDLRQVGWYYFQIIGGGLETTRNAGVIGLRELMYRPEQAQFLRDNPDRIPAAVEEIVRWVTPSKNRLRVATQDTEIGGKQIRKGDWVVAWIVSGNRDDSVFGNGDVFDTQREHNPHLGFGDGVHMCLGRNVARLELRILLDKFLNRFPDYSENGPVSWVADNNTTALKSLPVKFTPESAAVRIAANA